MNVGKLDIRVEISKVEQSIDVKNIWYVSKKFKFEQADMLCIEYLAKSLYSGGSERRDSMLVS